MGRPPAGKINTWLDAQVEAATRDPLEEEAVMDWQPIETAPKDGTPIILGRNFGEGLFVVREGWWQNAEDDGPDYMGADGGFVDHWFSDFQPSRSFGNPDYQREGCQPTHWMPLPEPPATTQEHGTTPRHNTAQHPDEDDS